MAAEALTCPRPDPATEHVPARPSWDCRACGAPWPCAPVKVTLLDEYREFPSVLMLYLATQFHAAVEDHLATTGAIPTDLYARFLAWPRRAPKPDRDQPALGAVPRRTKRPWRPA
ncbi:hypothetical protein GCM10010112_33930 [Actinoplanes lobatus]|uniref:Flavin reductase n=1 Tax=Actinoplanes lobatus TaxID=113568 RepID=A0A7W7HHP6_9ACTN|nr:hypothetical protein [Actinoplanes lobatus]MBB4750715.1 hypothetical protein [Actinoplanes lobatus]GGN68952.1 hypothetical protein GCM10010112_33930 [Actinoplanes lobatus]GIE42155.1 hypothetical protein Alo02nite_50530 [Actinoplanes lobatus]